MFLHLHVHLFWLNMHLHHISISLVVLTSFLILWHISLDCPCHSLQSLSLKGWMSPHFPVMSNILQNLDHPITLQMIHLLQLCQACHWWNLLWIAIMKLVLILLVFTLLSQIDHHIDNDIVVIPIMSILSWCLFWFYLTTSLFSCDLEAPF